MLNKFYKVSLLIGASALPLLTYAQEPLDKTGKIFGGAYGIVKGILIPLAFTAALLFFFWGIAKYIWAVGGDAKEDGKKIMVWGVVALFVMSSIWGLTAFLQDELLITPETGVDIPTINIKK